MRKEHSSRFIFSVFAVLGVLLVSAWGANTAHADTAGSQLSIAGNGQTMIRYATVVSVSGPIITISTVWGATTMTWTIETTGSTKFYPEGGTRDALKALKRGDSIGITGILDMKTARPTIRASAVRNLSLIEAGQAPETPTNTELPTLQPESNSGATSTGDVDDDLLVSGASTGLLAWLWRFLYGDPTSALSMR